MEASTTLHHTQSLRHAEGLAQWLEQLCSSKGDAVTIVGIGGPGGCGKSTLTRWLLQRIVDSEMLHLDDFRLPREERESRGLFGSHPEGNDLDLLRRIVADIRNRKAAMQPVFDAVAGRVTHSRPLRRATLFFADGEIASHKGVRPLWDSIVLVDAHWRTQLNTRLTRDLRERGYSLEKAITIFLQSNLRDYPIHSEGALSDADWVFYLATTGRLSVKKRPREGSSSLEPAPVDES